METSSVVLRDRDVRLVLGFDAGCMTCSDLARRLRDQIGEKIEVLSLRDPQVQDWRERALGEDAPWAPTLLEVRGNSVRAWTGWRMGAHMARVLGTTATWRVMQVLGEKDTVPVLGTGGAARLAGHFSRARFLQGVGGALLAASVLSGTNLLAPKASAQGWTHPLERVKFKSKERLVGAARREALSSAANSPDVRNLWTGSELPTKGAFAVRHTLENGTVLTAVSWTISEDKILVYYETDRPIGNYRSEATLLGYVPGEEVWKETESVNGRQRSVVGTAVRAAPDIQPLGCGCCRWRWGCVATVGAGCVGCGATCATCVGTPAKWACGACLSCALVGCPVGIRRCCANPSPC